MCGIAGYLGGLHEVSVPMQRDLLQRMGERILHRGPDHGGLWLDPQAQIGLVHRRLSIIDLSPAGHQPMASASGRWVLIFNGEIYNHRILRDRLDAAGQAPAWRGHSDTETLLAAIEAWGLETTLHRCTGMYAIALWDRQDARLWLARDRLGEKPLYVGWAGDALVFASEAKALRAHPGWDGAIDRDALASFFRWGYVPGPQTIWLGIRKLQPGTLMSVSLEEVRRRHLPEPRVYWSLAGVAAEGAARPFAGDEDEALAELDRHLRRAIRGQCIADVPLGAFLSGGVDSSTVVALMQAESTEPVRTFTIGFDDSRYDESAHAGAVARHLGTRHTGLVVSGPQALDVVPRLPTLYDEPFADPSQIPTVCLAALAREHVTVSLSGDGADELFGGYDRYRRTLRLAGAFDRIPGSVRGLAAGAFARGPAALIDAMAAVSRPSTLSLRAGIASRKAARLAQLLGVPDRASLYRHQFTHWDASIALVRGGREIPGPMHANDAQIAAFGSLEQWMMTVDGLVYLPDDVLAKVDRAAMAVGLETRVPFLDHRLVEFAYSLPAAWRTAGGNAKHLLKRLLERHVPRALIDRPKMGFGVPLDAWLRGPLRDWADDLLQGARLSREGYLDPAPVQAAWTAHTRGGASNGFYLWDVLMFQAWLEQEQTR